MPKAYKLALEDGLNFYSDLILRLISQILTFPDLISLCIVQFLHLKLLSFEHHKGTSMRSIPDLYAEGV